MTKEIRVPQLGEVRIRDVRAALGSEFSKAIFVDLLVLGRPGEPASAGRVYFVDRPSGRGCQRNLACPVCHLARAVLFTDAKGGLGCARCARRRTRHQLECACRSYRRDGGREEDELLRIVGRPTTAVERVEALAKQIVEIDRRRWEALQPDIALALSASQVRVKAIRSR